MDGLEITVLPFRLPTQEGLVLCFGAHCDDIEIGCGGTLLAMLQAYPRLRMQWVVFSSDQRRSIETREAAQRLGGSRIDVECCDFRNGYFPYVGAQIKDYFEGLKRRLLPDLIFSHWLLDRHQDHRTVAELTWNTYRDHLIVEYEVAKYEGDLGHPNLYVPLTPEIARTKVEILSEAFASQSEKQWFSDETFWAMLRIRGIECNSTSGYAEAFHARKFVVECCP